MADSQPALPAAVSATEPSVVKAALSRAQGMDQRVARAWRTWLASLATDADAAIAAAHLYAELPGAVREAWLDALLEDAPLVQAPRAALYGPLLAVERDVARRRRICEQGGVTPRPSDAVGRALVGRGASGRSVAVVVQPLYLDFVRVLICCYVRGRGFDTVHQEIIIRDGDAPQAGDVVSGVRLLAASPHALVDEVAHAVVAHGRAARQLPRPLRGWADLFSPRCSAAAGS